MTLPTEVQVLIAEEISAGRYPSAEAVLAAAAVAFREKQSLDRKREELRREIQLGLDDIEAGRVAPWDIDEILAEVRAEKASRMAEAG
jgi:antitoxin ParD1/3/4